MGDIILIYSWWTFVIHVKTQRSFCCKGRSDGTFFKEILELKWVLLKTSIILALCKPNSKQWDYSKWICQLKGTYWHCKWFVSEILNPFEVLLQPYLVLHLRKRKDEDRGADMGREIVFLFSFYVVAFIHALLDFFYSVCKRCAIFIRIPRHASASVGKRKMVFTWKLMGF